jgi:hypothetical protein
MTTRWPSGAVSDERGVVYVEFLIAVIPVWTLALSAFQLSLISAANLVVKHAADSAARSASVVLVDDPSEYAGEPTRSVAGSPRAPAHGNRSRMERIELAARVPLLPFSPRGVGLGARPTLERAISSTRALGAVLLRPSEVAVTFVGVEGALVAGPEATVRVAYLFECLVPIARRLLCNRRDALGGQRELPQAAFRLPAPLDERRYRHLAHQTTLLIHDAPYEYRPRGS